MDILRFWSPNCFEICVSELFRNCLRIRNCLSLCFFSYLPYRKTVQIKVLDFNDLCVLFDIADFLYDKSCRRNSIELNCCWLHGMCYI
jgi:hypothetical protein